MREDNGDGEGQESSKKHNQGEEKISKQVTERE